MINEEYCLQKNISHSSLLIPHLIIPNGKGKGDRHVRKNAEIKYQSPMGKVKLLVRFLSPEQAEKYQFPMGKVKKGRTKQKLVRLQTYQFSMGKVKYYVALGVFVSIPNGKGKIN